MLENWSEEVRIAGGCSHSQSFVHQRVNERVFHELMHTLNSFTADILFYYGFYWFFLNYLTIFIPLLSHFSTLIKDFLFVVNGDQRINASVIRVGQNNDGQIEFVGFSAFQKRRFELWNVAHFPSRVTVSTFCNGATECTVSAMSCVFEKHSTQREKEYSRVKSKAEYPAKPTNGSGTLERIP